MGEHGTLRPAAHQDESPPRRRSRSDGRHHLAVDQIGRGRISASVPSTRKVAEHARDARHHEDSLAGLVEVDETRASVARLDERAEEPGNGTGTGWARRRPATRARGAAPRRSRRGRWRCAVGSESSTRQRLSPTGRPRLSSASSTSPPASDRDREDPGRILGPRAGDAASMTSGSARLRGWVSRTTSRRGAGVVPQEPGQRPGRVGGQVAGLERARPQGIRGQPAGPRDRRRPGGREPDGELAAPGLPGQGHRRAGQDEPDVAPGAHPLIQQQHQLLDRRAARRLAVEVQQLALGEPAEELLVVERELDRQDLLGRRRGSSGPSSRRPAARSSSSAAGRQAQRPLQPARPAGSRPRAAASPRGPPASRPARRAGAGWRRRRRPHQGPAAEPQPVPDLLVGEPASRTVTSSSSIDGVAAGCSA